MKCISAFLISCFQPYLSLIGRNLVLGRLLNDPTRNAAMGLIDWFKGLFKGSQKQLKLLVVGLDNAGKTTIVTSLSDGDPSTVAPTTGFNVTSLTHTGYQLSIFDLGGQTYIRKYWDKYFKGTDGVVCFLRLFLRYDYFRFML